LRIITITVCLAACLLPGAGVFAQDYTGRIISDVEIRGLERVSEQLIRSQLEVQPGDAYDPAAVSRDVRRLYEGGLFSNVVADARVENGGLVIAYVVEEKRVIEEIRITGNRKVRDRQIRGVLSWREGDTFVPEAYDEEREAILGLYREKAYPQATVDIVVEEIGPSRVRITYKIDEGKKARVSSINIVGNENVPEKALKKAMSTKRAWWFFGGAFDEEVLNRDLERIEDLYGDYGRLEAEVTGADLDFNESGKRVEVTIYVDEGPAYRVQRLDVVENVVFGDDEIMPRLDVQPGDIHNVTQVEADAELVQQGYRDAGYISAQVEPQVTLDREEKTTRVIHRVREGDLKYVKQIDITGNTVTRDDVIRRELLIHPGERFDGTLLRASEQRLRGTEFFENVRFTLEPPETDEEYYSNLLVDVEEGKTGFFNFGAGYSTEEGVGGFTELRLNNFDITNPWRFTGGGQQLRLRLHLGSRRTQYALSFADPQFLGYPLLFGFDVYDERYEYRGGTDYTEDSQGGQIRFAKILSPHVTARAALRYSDTEISGLPWFAFITYPRDYWREREGSTTVSTAFGITRNTQDSRLDPSTGSRHDLELELAGFGGDNYFYKLEHDSTWLWPLDDDQEWILSFRTREGWMDEYGDSDYVPIQHRFFAGGTTTIRGYDIRDVGPKETGFFGLGEEVRVGGNLRLVQNLEVKYKLNERLRLYGFVDGGGVWSDAADFDFGGYRFAAGLGIGFDIPRMGPVRVDYGVPINPDDDQGGGRLHLQTGLAF
jgi:outer membrane protein insertion porin family